MPTTITSAGITFNDATTLTSANITLADGAVTNPKLADGAVTAAKLGTTEQKQIAKAWVNFNGTTSPGTIRSSYNVSSVTKNGTGDYTVNFTTAMADANYSVNGTASGVSFNGFVGPFPNIPLTGSNVRIGTQIYTNALVDQNQVSVAIFGN